MVNEEPNKAYYAVIPANVRYDKELPPNAKLLYGEITALCNQTGYCWASNEYFANLYKCGKRSVTSWISKLREKGYITVELERREGSKEIEKRYIKICNTTIESNCVGYSKNILDPIENNFHTPIEENCVENNTFSFNNTSNIKKERKRETNAASYDAILSEIKDVELRELYYEYIKMRKLIKSPMTDRALKTLITKVEAIEPIRTDKQKKMLETAIVNNWKSVYPLREDVDTAPKRSQYQDLYDHYMR